MSFLQVQAGPRPTNTLSRGVSRVSRGLNGVYQGGRQLETIGSTGFNVKSNSSESRPETFHFGEPRQKRRKLDQQHNSQKTPQLVDGSDEADQLMKDDDVVQVKHVTKLQDDENLEISKPSIKWGTSRPPDPNFSSSSQRGEYHAVEDLMNSSVKKSKRHKNRHRNGTQDTSATEGSSFASSKSESLEMLDTDLTASPIAKPVYQGTAYLHPSRRSQTASKSDPGRSAADRSPFFPPHTPEASINSKEQPRKIAGGSSATEPRMRDQYRDSDGRQRGGADSADELDNAEPNSRALSPVKSARSKSPTKIGQSIPTHRLSIKDQLKDPRPAQSNIKPFIFTKAAKNGSRLQVTPYHAKYPDEKPAPWNMPLRAYNSQGQTHKDDGLGLVYNESEKSYDIHCSGNNLAKRQRNLQIRPHKLQRIRWALEGTKMRFESSLTAGVDNVLDVELCTQKDVQTLNKALQEGGSFKVKEELRERMDTMFDRKLQDHHKAIQAGKHHMSEQPQDVLLADRRIDRADKRRASNEHHRPNSKRFRIIDGLSPDEVSHDAQRIQQNQSSAKPNIQKHRNTTDQGRSAAFDANSLNPLDNILKYTLRSSKPNGSLPRTTRETSPFWCNENNDKEEIQRYSKTHGLGKPWPKPLVYPKEGKKRTTVDFSDLERLDEGEFLNDNLIAFYLRYLEHQAEQSEPTMARKVYMFNTFFYASLTSTKAGQRSINYEAVQKWTRGIDIFTYDFVIVPVNESAHWYVAIICNLPILNRKLGGLDGEESAGLGSPDEIGLDPPVQPDPTFSSSPRTPDDENRREPSPHLNQAKEEDIKEIETAASFAEMSLEAGCATISMDGPTLESPGAFHSEGAEQDLLDHQLQQNANNGELQGDSNVQDVRSIGHEIGKTGTPTSPQLRPGKRKSLPSPRVFDPYKPTILTFDSFGTAHALTVKVLKQYLREEAKDKRGQMEFDEKELQGATAKQIPQQDNFCDCGLFLLGYMEKFFDDPRRFIDKVMRREWDLQKDWPKLDPSIMRANMRGLLMALGESQREEFESARNARRAITSAKRSKGLPSSPQTSISEHKPPNVDGANSADTTPSKAISEAAQPPSTSKTARWSAKDTEEPYQQMSRRTSKTAEESIGNLGEPVQQSLPLSKEPALESARHIDNPIQPAQQEPPLSRNAALESAATIDDSIEPQHASLSDVNPSKPALPPEESAAELHTAPPAATEEPPPQSFIVPDSQSQSSSPTKHKEPIQEDPDSFAMSPELPSTIQDSQPPIPELPLQDFHKEVTPPPPPKPKRHMTSFSSPLPQSKSSHAIKEDGISPRTPKHPKITHTPISEQKSVHETRSTRRPILGAKPAITGTNPMVVINIDD
ncbi:MAG: hypothetical protein Q9209_002137 [Squamulea sp. 1 TL-2023]